MKHPENIILAGTPGRLTTLVSRTMKPYQHRYELHHCDIEHRAMAVAGGKKPRVGIACFETVEEGLSMCKDLQQYYPSTLFIGFSQALHADELFHILRAGYVGSLYVEEIEQITDAVKMVEQKGCWISNKLFHLLLHPKCIFEERDISLKAWSEEMSPALYRLLELMIKHPDWSNQQLADSLYVSKKTVENTMTRLFNYLGVENRASLNSRVKTA